ncbi:MAG: uroporphyrinogen-III C-methyltransferase [Bryobacterales bacterium]|nr:uroporphyrinogen-III C-methyltransferase [Bryobacterales bacterium]
MTPGTVYLVGAGPGDPELITWKGRRVLERADCVLYDNLAAPALLDLAPASAERVYVGKKKAVHAYTQEEICAMLIERARRGLTVVRLKGGDPFIFGRGGEEAEALAAADVPFEVVPGVTTPLGIAAYCGVPLTHREHTSIVTFVTAHDLDTIDWTVAAAAETLVLFMGLTTLPGAAERLIGAGRDPGTPALAVRWATRPDQQTVAAPLGRLAEEVLRARLRPPATIVIGEVVRLRETLNWFERLPLFGQRIVITRAREQAASLTSRLRELGADAVEIPAIEIQPAADAAPLDRAIVELEQYDWLLFTSANGVRFFLDRLGASVRDLRALRGRLAAIGPATAAALEAAHLKVDLLAEEYVAESLIAGLLREPVAGKRFLLARAAVARDVLPGRLRAEGARVDVVEAYRTVAAAGLVERIGAVFAERRPDWITFTSSSTASHFVHAAGSLDGVRIASIGPVTSATLRNLGLSVDLEARRYDISGLIEALLARVSSYN